VRFGQWARQGYFDYEAEARLIDDNLLDSELPDLVHANSFQSGPEFADSAPKPHALNIADQLAGLAKHRNDPFLEGSYLFDVGQ